MKYLKIIFGTAIQMLSFVLLYHFLWYVLSTCTALLQVGAAWDVTTVIAIVVMFFLSLVTNIILGLSTDNTYQGRMRAVVTSSMIYFILVGAMFSDGPYRIGLLIFCSIISSFTLLIPIHNEKPKRVWY